MFTPSVFRRSFNEEADLLTPLQKGPSSTSMGSPWKPFLLLSVISGLSGKKFKSWWLDIIVRNSCTEKSTKELTLDEKVQLSVKSTVTTLHLEM